MASTFLYEVLIRGNSDGTLQGAHQTVSTLNDDGSITTGIPTGVDPTNTAVAAILGAFATTAQQITDLTAQVASLQRQVQQLTLPKAPS